MSNRLLLSTDPKPSDWLRLRSVYPPAFHRLIDLCFNLERHLSRFDRLGIDYLTDKRMRHISDLAQRILYEYKALLGQNPQVNKELAQMTTLIFIGSKESYLTKYVQSDLSRKQDYLKGYIQQLQTMMHVRIYDTLAQIDITEQLKTAFSKAALTKIGVYEAMRKEEEKDRLY